ncbi:Acyl-CoA thioesterase II [Moritella sp. JT01]|uniref:acyl-CoA thioesterase II n=1 Tax=Moritella sp. JT01 TaxID=756698 RepID=UPI0007952B8E|nr:acyl-CoA thioesterase II [Moritella sp. JT01]KXO10100.1 Acyl-CoA thioesterase II [Moritella sp. JT01]
MGKVLKDLLGQLTLETIEEGIYRGQSQDLGFGAVFGGQVMGQALSAAKETVPADRKVHSFHSYFLRAGEVTKPIVYEVENIRDGGSITTRRVRAIQNGKAIFYMTASFQIELEGYDHQDEMPDVPPPEELVSEQDHVLSLRDELPDDICAKFVCERPIEMRPVHYLNPLSEEKSAPVRYVWFKANGQMPDDARIHKYLLAYASDFCLLPTALQPHGKGFMSPNMQVVTIDHSMWFHRDFRLDDWLLYAIDSSSASGSRGLVRGRFFTRDGKMVATTMQEGLIRNREIA